MSAVRAVRRNELHALCDRIVRVAEGKDDPLTLQQLKDRVVDDAALPLLQLERAFDEMCAGWEPVRQLIQRTVPGRVRDSYGAIAARMIEDLRQEKARWMELATRRIDLSFWTSAPNPKEPDGTQPTEPDPQVLRVRTPAAPAAGGEQAAGRPGPADGGEPAAERGDERGSAEAARGEGLLRPGEAVEGAWRRAEGVLKPAQAGLNLYHVQDPDRPMYVAATSLADAVERYAEQMRCENDGDPCDPPQGVAHICDANELLLGEPSDNLLAPKTSPTDAEVEGCDVDSLRQALFARNNDVERLIREREELRQMFGMLAWLARHHARAVPHARICTKERCGCYLEPLNAFLDQVDDGRKLERGRWRRVVRTSPSGKVLYVCICCGRLSPSPDKGCKTIEDPGESWGCSKWPAQEIEAKGG